MGRGELGHSPCENSSLHRMMPSKKKDITSKRVSAGGPEKLFDRSDSLHNVRYKYHICKAKVPPGDGGSFHVFLPLVFSPRADRAAGGCRRLCEITNALSTPTSFIPGLCSETRGGLGANTAAKPFVASVNAGTSRHNAP